MLTGRSIVITGAGAGIGRACAVLAARLGAAVVVNDVAGDAAAAVANEINAAGGRAVADPTDISSWSGAEHVVEHCVENFGKIDGLVNNAAILRPGVFETLDESAWRATVEVNILGVAFMMTHAARSMFKGNGGSIVNLISGAHQGAPDLVPYGTSKGAVASMIYCGAIDLGPRGVRVNGVSPVAATQMEAKAAAFREKVGGHIGTPTLTPEDNAPAVCFLLSDDSRDFNGQVLRMEQDGLSILGHPTVLLPYPRIKTDDYTAVRDAALMQLAAMIQPLGIRYGHLVHN